MPTKLENPEIKLMEVSIKRFEISSKQRFCKVGSSMKEVVTKT
jgi:hypothetical protein